MRSHEKLVDTYPDVQDYHKLTVDEVFQAFETSTAGLTHNQAHQRVNHFGPNALNPPREWPLFMKFIFQLFTGFGPLLWIAASITYLSWRPLGGSNPSIYSLALANLLLAVIFLQVGGSSHRKPSCSLSVFSSSLFLIVHPTRCFVEFSFHHMCPICRLGLISTKNTKRLESFERLKTCFPCSVQSLATVRSSKSMLLNLPSVMW
jgi:magnesium-transporting ATPase (P-type)